MKRYRPIASGRLSPSLAIAVAAMAIVVAPAIAMMIRPGFGLILIFYIVLILAYSIWIKHLVIVDVFAISGGFVLRAAGGAVVLRCRSVPGSMSAPYCSRSFSDSENDETRCKLLEVSLAFTGEIWTSTRSGFLDQLILLTAAATIMSYSLYTFTAESA